MMKIFIPFHLIPYSDNRLCSSRKLLVQQFSFINDFCAVAGGEAVGTLLAQEERKGSYTHTETRAYTQFTMQKAAACSTACLYKAFYSYSGRSRGI